MQSSYRSARMGSSARTKRDSKIKHELGRSLPRGRLQGTFLIFLVGLTPDAPVGRVSAHTGNDPLARKSLEARKSGPLCLGQPRNSGWAALPFKRRAPGLTKPAHRGCPRPSSAALRAGREIPLPRMRGSFASLRPLRSSHARFAVRARRRPQSVAKPPPTPIPGAGARFGSEASADEQDRSRAAFGIKTGALSRNHRQFSPGPAMPACPLPGTPALARL